MDGNSRGRQLNESSNNQRYYAAIQFDKKKTVYTCLCMHADNHMHRHKLIEINESVSNPIEF